ncbi:putative SOS response-associated peptidase YedK [Lactobacillus colini]|uniref:Abasic site processing protein n=1 Tax=Lactobacillus colini TaxID=1819254 RepID=A0ABS4MD66_9LACO|nr:SOS response-associated peptidase family protein [Lactobacillus colini]MBP2057349.1 putative SOS response-associated peptidase YedK [Lactobacillus colini]
MCSHYQQPSIKLMQQYLKEDLHLPLADQDFSKSIYTESQHIFPKKESLLLLKSSSGKVGFMPKKWGYPNPFDEKKLIINARIEKMQYSNSMWRESFQKRRCIIIASQFFEAGYDTYLAENGKRYREKFSFKTKSAPLTFIAGIYEQDHFAMITTQPTTSYAQVHDRMPLILNAANLNNWFQYDISSILNDKSIELVKTPILD